MKLERTSDGYFKLKDLMKTWGRKHDLTTEDVLSAITGSLFKTMRNEMRANFLIFQEDEAGAEILLSIPDRSVRWVRYRAAPPLPSPLKPPQRPFLSMT
jgi:hypothetical protein